ncbi:MAG: hypothetical protein ACE5RH_04110, partial [Nitrosarchaeum sp.]
SGCAGYTINGIPSEGFRNITPKEGIKSLGGFAASNLVHIVGHAVVYGSMHKSWHIESARYEIVDGYLTDSEAAWAGRAGFIAQLIGGYALNKLGPKNSYFVAGYNMGSFFKISTYPILEGTYSDLELISRNSNSELEYGLYTAASIYLMDIHKK